MIKTAVTHIRAPDEQDRWEDEDHFWDARSGVYRVVQEDMLPGQVTSRH